MKLIELMNKPGNVNNNQNGRNHQSMTIHRSIIFLCLVLASINNIFAQVKSENDLITLSGIIICNDSIVGALPDVNIFNKTGNWGTTSDSNGHFSVRIGLNDTIWFSTIQHVEQFYVMPTTKSYQDHEIVIFMKQDTIWLNAVTIYGYYTLEKFKNEILQLDLPNDDISVAIPILDKYSKQRKTGDGNYIIEGPLTELFHKFNRISRLKNK